MIYLHVYSGLTSRCNSMAQAYQLAKRYNERLVIFWEIQTDCNISYKDIFDERQFHDVKYKVVEYNAMLPRIRIKRYISILKRQLMKSAFLFFVRLCRGLYIDYAPPEGMSWLGTDMKRRILRCGREVIYALDQKKSVLISAFNGLAIDQINSVSCCREIVFKQKFMKRAEALITPGSMWVGVHIRRTDHEIAKKHSTFEAFVEKMEEMKNTYSSVKFWLATDDRQVEKSICKIFKDEVYVLRGKRWGRNSQKAMECAVMDCICLSKCDVILGSFGSSYSGFAAHFGNKELIVIE